MASVKAHKATKKASGKGKVKRMTIEHASNGFTSTIHRERPPHENGMYMGPSEEDKPTIHGSVSHLAKHVKATFGGGGTDNEAADEAAEGE